MFGKKPLVIVSGLHEEAEEWDGYENQTVRRSDSLKEDRRGRTPHYEGRRHPWCYQVKLVKNMTEKER